MLINGFLMKGITFACLSVTVRRLLFAYLLAFSWIKSNLDHATMPVAMASKKDKKKKN